MYPAEWLAVCHDFNTPIEVARCLYLLSSLLYQSDPTAWLTVSFRVVTKKFIEVNHQLTASWSANRVPSGGLEFRINPDTSLDSILKQLLEIVYGALYGTRVDSTVLSPADGLFIETMTVLPRRFGPVNQAGQGTTHTISPLSQNLLLRLLKELRAYSIPAAWMKQFASVSSRRFW